MARLGLIALVLALSGCASAPESFTPGKEVPPPFGWLDYCGRNPTDTDCKGDNQ
jgi:hypothetical protein